MCTVYTVHSFNLISIKVAAYGKGFKYCFSLHIDIDRYILKL